MDTEVDIIIAAFKIIELDSPGAVGGTCLLVTPATTWSLIRDEVVVAAAQAARRRAGDGRRSQTPSRRWLDVNRHVFPGRPGSVDGTSGRPSNVRVDDGEL